MYDVAIIGAGPGGSATAHFLARRGLKVLLLDKAEFPRDKTCGDGLTPRAIAVLQEVGLEEDLGRVGRVVRQFAVFAPNGANTRAPIAPSGDLPDYSMVVPRLLLDDLILRRAVQSGATFLSGVRVTGVVSRNAPSPSVEITLERAGGLEQLHARMAVIATGANPRLLLQSRILQRPPRVMAASRAYFEGVRGLGDVWSLRFDRVCMPGYGWIFPTGAETANIGTGRFRGGDGSTAKSFARFVDSPPLREMLNGAKQAGPLKGWPLRDDFLTSPTFGDRVLLVGEAAGLVNPLTGEGIDYALESGRIAAQHLADMFDLGDFSRARHEGYDAALRGRYQSLFEFSLLVRRVSMNPLLLNILVGLANRRDDLRTRLMHMMLGDTPVPGRLSFARFPGILKTLVVAPRMPAGLDN